MKAIVESTNFVMDSDILPILKAIHLSENVTDLKSAMGKVMGRVSKYVKYGFGGSHMWASNVLTNERLILVELND